jgi:hypothetical protein
MNDKNDLTRRKVMQALAGVGALGPSVGSAVGSRGTTAQGQSTQPSPTSSNTIAYQKLTAKAKRAFNAALGQGQYRLGRPCHTPRQLVKYDYVKYRNSLYSLNLNHGMEAEYGIDLRRTYESDIPSLDSVVSYNQLSSKAQKEFNNGIRDQWVPTKRQFPTELVNNRYVKYNGDYYDTNPHHRDALTYSITPRQL